MPTSSTLDKHLLKGYLFCLYHQGVSRADAYSNLLEFTKTEVFTHEEFRELFHDFSIGNYNLNTYSNLVLAENGVFQDSAVLEFLTYRYSSTFFSELYNEVLKITGKPLFTKDEIKDWSEKIFKKNHFRMELRREFNKIALMGFLICLKVQNKSAKEAHSNLLEVTRQEVVDLEKVEALFKDTTHYFVQEDFTEELWKAVHQYHIMEKIVFFADLDVRKSLHQTGGWIRDLIDTHPYEIDCINIDFSNDHIQIKSDPKIPQQKFQNFFGCGCVVHSGNQVYLEKIQHDFHYKCHLKRILRKISSLENITIGSLKLRANLTRVRASELDIFPTETLRITNFYLKVDIFHAILNFMGSFSPDHLKKLVVWVTGNLRFVPRGMEEIAQWTASEVLITNQRFDDFGNGEALEHFKFAIFQLHYVVTIDQILAIKDNLLKHPDLREFKITAQMLPDHYDEINIRLGTYNQRGTQTPRWAQFPYPNEAKTLELTVLENLVWFRGPEYIPGECEAAEQELVGVEELNETVFEDYDYSR
uniref:FTH domain-containing protein n=1 Tax=Caenorhabditis tropicalis TaxID=1561998 RepID=A0A1I7UYN7_9PELO